MAENLETTHVWRFELKEVTQCKTCSKTAAKVSKKVTTFGENIRPGQCQPYAYDSTLSL